MKRIIGFALLVFSLAGVAQTYPTKPVRIVVTADPGGSDDLMGRILAKQLTEATGRQFLVENRPGGGAVIGRQYVARAARDLPRAA